MDFLVTLRGCVGARKWSTGFSDSEKANLGLRLEKEQRQIWGSNPHFSITQYQPSSVCNYRLRANEEGTSIYVLLSHICLLALPFYFLSFSFVHFLWFSSVRLALSPLCLSHSLCPCMITENCMETVQELCGERLTPLAGWHSTPTRDWPQAST